jgi:hypothetical protein
MSKPKVSISQSIRPDAEGGYGLRLSCEAELECASPNACPEAHFDFQFNEQNAHRLSNKLKVRQYARSLKNKIRQHADIDASSSFVSKNFGRFACSSVFGGASAELEPYNGMSMVGVVPIQVKIFDVQATAVKLSWRLPAPKRHELTKEVKVGGYIIEHRTSIDKTWRPLDSFLTSDRIVGSFLLRVSPNTKYQVTMNSN